MIFYGADVTEREAQKVLKLFTDACPNAEITLLSGGQPVVLLHDLGGVICVKRGTAFAVPLFSEGEVALYV